MSDQISPYHEGSHFWTSFWVDHLRAGIKEDQPQWDWTANGIVPRTISAEIVAKADGVWAGNLTLNAMKELTGVDVQLEFSDGDYVRSGQPVCSFEGSSSAILGFERTVLNLASYVSGVASQTRQFVAKSIEKLGDKAPRICATRKLIPYYRDIATYGVLAGGGHCYRLNLSGGTLIKENHIRIAGGIPEAIAAAKRFKPHGIRIEVEVTSMKEAKVALEHGAEVLLLDNFSGKELVVAVRELKGFAPNILLVASGGITLENLDDYLIEGIDVLGIGSITHSVKALDLSLLVEG